MENLSLYIHIPFCVRKCLYCDFLSGPHSAGMQERYVKALCREIEETSSEYREFQVVSVFIGGGTPSVLKPDQMKRIMKKVKNCFQFTGDCEISMEMNPGTVTAEKMRTYRDCGINRISIGLQSAQNQELKALGRIHTYEDFLKIYEMAAEAGFTNINVDLMSAIPEQTLGTYEDTLQKVLSLQPQPSHISAYSLIVEEGTPFYEHTPILPDEETERRMYEITDDILKKAGYHRYEISNYAKEGKECFHNKVYWQRENYLGLGIGSASMIRNVRFHNTSDMERYINLLSHAGKRCAEESGISADSEWGRTGNRALREEIQNLSMEEQMEEFMFLGLRMMQGVSERKFYACFGKHFEEVFPGVIAKHERLGLLETMPEFPDPKRNQESLSESGAGSEEKFVQVKLTPRGIDVSNGVFADFLLTC